MTTLLEIVASWQSLAAFLVAVATFGFFPGFLLRLLVRLYPPGDPRRHELPAELYAVPRLVRPFWVAEQFETVLYEGTGLRYRARRTRALAKRLAADGLTALDHEARRAIDDARACDDDMVFVELGATTLIAQRVGDLRRRKPRWVSEWLRGAVRQATSSPRRRRYIRELRFRMTARIGPPVSFIGEVAGERTPGDLLPEDPDAVRAGMGLGVRAAADSPRTM
ncbi:hypothetical protein [Nocardia fusca]|uniref:hypothetical protein n=1 Tax=Nocardia fusca TaxID=941183 RepID=UPI0007A73186|nr:hypothetical protein [Nocardia fusca]